MHDSSDAGHRAAWGKHRGGEYADCGDSQSTQNIAAPDNDGMEQSNVTGLAIGAAVVLVVALVVLALRSRKRRRHFVPTPSLILHLHAQMDSPRIDAELRLPQFRPLGKHRGSTTTTATDLSARSSATTIVPPRQLSKGSSGSSSVLDSGMLMSACVDPLITSVRVPLGEISFVELVGRGGFGEVYRAFFDDHVVAVKRIVPDRRSDLVYVEALLAEVQTLAQLDHAHIVSFVGVAWNSLSDLCVVSEFMEGGDLKALLHRYERVDHRPRGFDADKTRLALHVAHAIAYLHSLTPALLHRDIKSRNVLLDKHHQHAKLADFGVARQRIDSAMAAGVGSTLWMAPEVMVGGKYSEKADIYSFGVVLSELDTHLSPYWHVREPREGRKKIPDVTIIQMVSMGKLRVEFSDCQNTVSQQMVELALQCIARDPSARPTAAQVMHRIHLIYRAVM